MKKNKIGVYIHIPFCKSICTYCDFCKMFYRSEWAKKYILALRDEIKERYKGEEVSTIYIGGGTPSSLGPIELKALLALTNIFNKKNLEEFTFECNLNDITDKLATELKLAGVTRVSIGIESFNELNLNFLGRAHTYNEAKEKIEILRSHNINNINIDLMYAIPGESIKELKSDLDKITDLNPTHISTYSLMIEENTILHNNGVEPIDEALDSKMYKLINDYLEDIGYIHYEISNFALKGYESKHNLKYWHNEEYYGFGLGASGYLDEFRYTNTKNLTKYLNGKYKGLENDLLSKKIIMDNELMLGLRLTKGIDINEFKEKYNINIFEAYPIKALIKSKDLKLKKNRLFIPKNKLYIMNEILLKII